MGDGYVPGPVGIANKSGSVRRGPCGISDNRESCRQVSSNLFTILLQSERFKIVYDKIKNLGVTFIVDPKLSLKASARLNSPSAGRYDLITNTIAVPPEVYNSKIQIKSVNMLTTIAHEAYHAHQFENLFPLSQCKSPQERAKRYAEYAKKIGRDQFVKNNFEIEKSAEKFAQYVVLEALKNDHSGLKTYRQVLGLNASPENYYNFIIGTWESANEGWYNDEAEIEWVQWIYRYEKKDYEPEFNKAEMLKWLQQHPEVKEGIAPK